MRRLLAGTFGCLIMVALLAGHPASQTDPTVGLRDNTPRTHALINARIVQGPGRVIEHGTVVVRDGTIEAVGEKVDVPADARVWDYEGLTIYAGMIDMYAHVGLVKKDKDDKSGDAGSPYWNKKITPQNDVLLSFDPKEKDLESMRSLGFTTAMIVPDKGIIRGHTAVVTMGDGEANDRVVKAAAAQSFSMVHRRSFGRSATYPTALMGQISLLRQSFMDAQWYAAAQAAFAANPNQERPEDNDALDALAQDLEAKRKFVCEVDGELNLLRGKKIVDEFELDVWYRGSGHEYRVADMLKSSKSKVIVTLNFPKKPDVDSPEDALNVGLDELQHWEAAPANAAALEQAGVEFALTTNGLKKKKDFHGQVGKAIDRGLSTDAALAAVTTVPASLLGLDETMGSVDRGKSAHLVVVDGELFQKKTKVVDVWVDGEHYDINPRPEIDPRGNWQFTLASAGLGDEAIDLKIKGEIKKLKGTLTRDSTEVSCETIELDHHRVALTFAGDDLDIDGVVSLSGAVDGDALAGQGALPNGDWFAWRATRVVEEEDADDEESADKKDADADKKEDALALPTSRGAFGAMEMPEQAKHVFVQNATIWTSGPDGKLENADLLISKGKIAKVGSGLKAPSGAVVIDGTGKHVTAGIIDCHSHSATSGGVNEAGQAVTCEVGIESVLNPYDIALYRELAGGLTTINILHGSANPIGGQNAVIKLRWGGNADDMLFEGAKPGVKFALGENVKQSNWGDDYRTRYPQTRMGVEQIMRDRFLAAQEYQAEWENYKKKKGVIPPRRDLELEALAEVLDGERLVHSHSYRQDEILMLVRIADDFGFQIGTFQHVLEGYKIAEALATHGAGASTFSDWWAYKFEVYDAIPHNGALMYEAGVLVSFNSDSNELARRMNLEAAKAVRYGGVPESDALKFVTLNPAIQLRIDDRVGSLEEGKDGDFVLWSGSPLSTYSICEQTWIDGRKYFDIETDKQMREQVMAERSRLVQLVLGGDDKSKDKDKSQSGKATR